MVYNDKFRVDVWRNSIDVYSFEKENREYFERSLPPRPAHYFDSESFKEITKTYVNTKDIVNQTVGEIAFRNLKN